MNHRITAAACLAALLTLTACSGSTTSEGGTHRTPVSTLTATHSTPETAFLTSVRNKIPDLKRVPDDQLLTLAHASCTAIDDGNSPADVAGTAESGLKIGAANSGYVIGAAVSQFCPKHKDEL